MQPKVIQDPGERPLILFSDSFGIIAGKTFLQRALLFAELSMIAYNDEAEATRAAAEIGFTDVTFFDNRGAQAYRFRNRHNSVIACRGTEPNEWTDIRADVDAVSVLAETAGKVHRGFKREVDNLWPMLETSLMNNKQPVYFTGHSLGGAMAKICAGRCLLSHVATNPQQLFTYGSPRVGNRSYVNFVTLDHYRFVNNNDIVTRAPPMWFGYQHSGHEVYFNRNGDIKQYGYLMKRRDRWRGFLSELMRWKIDHLGDHSIHRYCENLVKAVLAEKELLAAGGEPYTPCKLTIAPPDKPH